MEAFARRVMSGQQRGPGAGLLRAALAAAEPFYAAGARARNWAFDAGIRRSHRLPRPVFSVGNVTTGGTGKTPVVRWLAGRLRDAGRHVAVLARGYGARPGELGDEQLMLRRLLNDSSEAAPVPVIAHPDRVAAARGLLMEQPEVDVFVLDDGFQHRRLARDLDIVLVSAAHPFGYGHVLPRGMLREPMSGLRRAGAVILTHSDQAPAHQLADIERTVRRYHQSVPIYRAVHAHTCLHGPDDARPRPLDDLRGRKWFMLSGVGDPRTFARQRESIGGSAAGSRAFPDHHRYTDADLAAVRRDADAAGADVIVTTEKDWSKLRHLDGGHGRTPPVWRVDLAIQFVGDGEEGRLWQQVLRVLAAPR
jgi:tetraacyldisaccharide 4'-kinase